MHAIAAGRQHTRVRLDRPSPKAKAKTANPFTPPLRSPRRVFAVSYELNRARTAVASHRLVLIILK
ncbi:hypothetical protein D8O27_07290 [Burkholderia mallei]|uniref:Uncharacterized protein n=1 Tax=Burkholderia mallei TaxID=13373 RepID=A0AAX1XAA1_BURML|nr:hypothetical protein EGY15_31445 [Burkholderia pseudomallei]EDK51919.1 hypothetical protein BMAFMH_F0039 [Burkholderia mallei FMH]EDK57059.1 hypothetical protein BMAJHU_J0037 [Burkholderia mallei JHU]EDP84609.1 hypothetical protein BMA10399_A0602 [Burkholderia mallei ATCC 10399]RKO00677.1 hypothetical protein D8O31_07250 [Burkholderia mallei]